MGSRGLHKFTGCDTPRQITFCFIYLLGFIQTISFGIFSDSTVQQDLGRKLLCAFLPVFEVARLEFKGDCRLHN